MLEANIKAMKSDSISVKREQGKIAAVLTKFKK